jgi:peptidoglycan/xylan/chitin deacetylase (PgdA/CDA1 family)
VENSSLTTRRNPRPGPLRASGTVSFRRLVKRTAEMTLIRSRLAERVFHRRNPRCLVLLYHNVVEQDATVSGEGALHLGIQDFVDQIEWLVEHFEIVPVSAVLGDDRGRRPRVAITFDDAYRGAVELAIPELTRRGLPSTVFVAPGLLGGQVAWWDVYAPVLGTHLDGQTFRDAALWGGRGDRRTVERLAAMHRLQVGCPPRGESIADVSQVADLAPHPLVTLAPHSMTHANLAALSDEPLARELLAPLEWFAHRQLPFEPWIAYPFGLLSPRVTAAAAKAGYTQGFEVAGGWVSRTAPVDPLRLPRLTVSRGVSLDGFKLRVYGVIA